MGYSGSRARCVPLQYPSSATRGVKQALNKKPLNPNIVLLSTSLQEKTNSLDKALNSLTKESTDQVSQSESGMFYELSNRNRMECEKYQDCSWFQQSPLKSDHNNKLSLAETFDLFFDANECGLPVPCADAQISPWGDEYMEVFTDESLPCENLGLVEKNKIFISNENFYTNHKGDEIAFDSYRVNFNLKKTDSIDSMKNISSTNPAEIIPISYKERLSNSNFGLTNLDEVKSDVKQEIESYSPASNSYVMDSDDSDLNIGREEIVEETDAEDLQETDKKEVEDSVKNSEIQADEVSSEYALNFSPNKKDDILDKNSFNKTPLPFKSEFRKNCNLTTEEKFDLNLDVAKLNFEQSLNVNTPDLDFMDLVDFINAEIRQENVNPSDSNSTPHTIICQKVDTKQNIVSAKNEVNEENFKLVHEVSPHPPTSENAENSWCINLKDITADASERSNSGVSIAERIKTTAKRKTRKIIKDLIDTEDEESWESADDEDYDYREDIAKRIFVHLKRGTKSSLSESSGDNRKIKESDSYRERRDKNNEASRRSRQNRKAKERHMYETLEEEEKRNVKLKAEADILEKQVTSLRHLLLQVVLRKGGAT